MLLWSPFGVKTGSEFDMYIIINANAVDIVNGIEKCIFRNRKQFLTALLVLHSETYVSLVVCFYVIQIEDSLL